MNTTQLIDKARDMVTLPDGKISNYIGDEDLHYASVLAMIAQAEALNRIATVLEDVWNVDLSTLQVSAPNGFAVSDPYVE